MAQTLAGVFVINTFQGPQYMSSVERVRRTSGDGQLYGGRTSGQHHDVYGQHDKGGEHTTEHVPRSFVIDCHSAVKSLLREIPDHHLGLFQFQPMDKPIHV